MKSTPMQKARAQLIAGHPFFAALLFRMRIEEAPQIKTAATDGKRVIYNPEWFEGLTADERVFVLAHEAMHCASLHHLRRGARDPRKWNRACDYVINFELVEASVSTMPDGGLLDPRYAHKSAEQVYAELPDEPEGNGDDPGQCGGIMDAPGADGGAATPAEQRQAETDWKVATLQAAQTAKMQGHAPGCAERLAEAYRKPAADWREVLRRFLTVASAHDDYTWRRPSRRFAHAGLYLPSPYSEAMGPIAVAVDTSGSIGDDRLAQFCAEVRAIADEMRPESVTVIYCHSRVCRVDVFERGEEVRFHPVKTGGTDFRPAFAEIARRDLEPAAVVYLTDLYGDAPDHEQWPTIWACTSPEMTGPWGETVHIPA